MAIAPEGCKLLRVEARNVQTPTEKKPDWVRITAVVDEDYTDIRSLVSTSSLHMVCQEAQCPDIYECW